MSEPRFYTRERGDVHCWEVVDRSLSAPIVESASTGEMGAEEVALVADALNAAHARGDLDAPKQQPALHTRANGHCVERVEDERKKDLGRFYAGKNLCVRERGTGNLAINPYNEKRLGFPMMIAEHLAAFLNDNYDRRASSPAATAARDAVRAQEPEPDEREKDIGRLSLDSDNHFRERGTGLILVSRNSGLGLKHLPLLHELLDRRQRTGTRADRREGGA